MQWVSNFLAICPIVNLIVDSDPEPGTNAASEPGKWFDFAEEEFNQMVGYENWHKHEFEIVQKGSHSWEGKVVVYKTESYDGKGIFSGQKADEEGAAAGDWKTSDTITLKRCINPGRICCILIKYFHHFSQN